ncbi:heparinase [Opitutaceae bacterium TAV5]|nr:heparinase [Opitutaceae bacterium TAV5]
MTRTTPLFTVLVVFVFPVLASLRVTAAGPLPLITPDDVARTLAVNSAAWSEKIGNTTPRLFFSDAQWPRVRSEIVALSGNPGESRAGLPARFVQEMDALLQKPVPAYLPPEKIVGTRGDARTLYSAKEELWQREVGDRIFALALAARLYPEKPYRDKMHDLVLATLDYETWGRELHRGMGDNADLAAGHIARGIATAWDWHREAFTPAEQTRIIDTVAARLPALLRGLYGAAFWARGYADNHNHVSVAALGFCGIAFYTDIPDAPAWLAAARLNFRKVADAFPADGSSEEGVSYWAYGMSYILQYIEATRLITDSADLYQKSFLKNAANYRLHASTSDLAGNLIWGDAVPRDWSTPHFIIYRLASEYRDADASWFADRLPPPRGEADTHALNLLWSRTAPPPAPEGPRALDAHLFASDIVTTRSGWMPDDYLLSIKSGYTNRNHSHLDAGALSLAFGSEWLLTAPGYGRGGGDRDFWQSGGPRWNYFSNGTESHATLLINGKNQRYTRDARGTITRFFTAPDWNATTIDLTGAYDDVTAVSRQVLHSRGHYILVFDTVDTPAPATVEWLGQFRKKPVQESDNTLRCESQSGTLRVQLLASTPASVPFTLRQPTLPNVDVNRNAHITWAARQADARHASFITLLQPVTAANVDSTRPFETRVTENGNRIEITTDAWTDHIVRSPAENPSSSAPLHFPDLEPGGRFAARLALLRTGADVPRTLLLLDATRIKLPGFSWRSDDGKPRDLTLEKTPQGNWNATSPASSTSP